MNQFSNEEVTEEIPLRVLVVRTGYASSLVRTITVCDASDDEIMELARNAVLNMVEWNYEVKPLSKDDE